MTPIEAELAGVRYGWVTFEIVDDMYVWRKPAEPSHTDPWRQTGETLCLPTFYSADLIKRCLASWEAGARTKRPEDAA